MKSSNSLNVNLLELANDLKGKGDGVYTVYPEKVEGFQTADVSEAALVNARGLLVDGRHWVKLTIKDGELSSSFSEPATARQGCTAAQAAADKRS